MAHDTIAVNRTRRCTSADGSSRFVHVQYPISTGGRVRSDADASEKHVLRRLQPQAHSTKQFSTPVRGHYGEAYSAKGCRRSLVPTKNTGMARRDRIFASNLFLFCAFLCLRENEAPPVSY
jgi:hypothetical protein